MLRFTVYDQEKTVSFDGDTRLARCLVAVCAGSPALLEDLMVAVEGYAEGTTERIVRGLLDFDDTYTPRPAAMRGALASDIGDAVALPAIVEVVDAPTELLAATPGPDGLIVIDLAIYYISGFVVSSEPLMACGVLSVGAGAFTRKVAYALGESWTVDIETRTPGLSADPASGVKKELVHV